MTDVYVQDGTNGRVLTRRRVGTCQPGGVVEGLHLYNQCLEVSGTGPVIIQNCVIVHNHHEAGTGGIHMATNTGTHVWSTWVDSSTTTTGSTTATDARVWSAWGVEYGTSTTGPIYYDSTTITNSDVYVWGEWTEQHEVRAQTKRERLAEARRQEAAARERTRQEEVRRQREAQAVQRAEELLRSVLTKHQQETLEKHRWIEVWSQKGRRFRIRMGRAHNVIELDQQGREITEYCAHVRDCVPNADNVLAQKLMLEHKEAEFEMIANKRRLIAV